MSYTKQTWANDAVGGTPMSAARLTYMETGIEAAAAAADQAASDAGNLKAGVEGIKIHDLTTGGGTRPSGYTRVRWVGGTTRPTNMLTGDIWEHDV